MSNMGELEEAASFFKKLDAELYKEIDQHYFDRPKKFKALLEVIDVLGKKLEQSDDSGTTLTSLQSKNSAYNKLLQQRNFISNVIEDVVKFQHGSLNSCVETMGDVLTEYTRSKDEVGVIRTSLQEIREVLTSKRNKQSDLKSLYLRKTEYEETIRILDDIEKLKDAPIRVQHFIQQKKYLTAVTTLTSSISSMFNADMVHIDALSLVREHLMEQKGKILEHIVAELKLTLVDGVLKKNTSMIRNARARSVFGDDETATVEGSAHESEDAHSESISDSGHLRSMKRGLKQFRPADKNQWSLDLNEATEAIEFNLSEPYQNPSLYTRLLVNAVGALQCEEDVERMMFEGISQQYHAAILALKKQRIQATAEIASDYQTSVLSFTAYTRDLLDSAILTIKNVIHFLRLLGVSKWRRKMNLETTNLKYDKKNEMTEILKLKESNVNSILHFCEEAESLIVTELQRHFLEQEVEEMSDQVGLRSKGRGEGAAFGSYAETEESDDDASPDDALLICAPTVKLAAPIYRDVLLFNERLMKMLNEEVAIKVPNGLVLTAVQKSLESDLLPLVQSLVNADMREIQTNPDLFSPCFKNALEEDRICIAARNCLSIIKPLLTYWLQLPQHREQVATILDRVLRGYVSAAREELESISWKYPATAAPKYKDSVLLSILADPVFAGYRQHIYEGKTCVEELLRQVAVIRRLPSADSASSLDTACLSEFDTCDMLWGSTMVVDKLNKDYSGISVLASIAYSCDYLTIQISKMSVTIAKRAVLSSQSPTATLATTRATFSGVVTPKEQSPLLTLMQGGLAELAHVAEECFALLRAEMQISGYYFMRQLVTIQMGTSQLYANETRKNYDSHQEPDAMVTAFNHHLMSFQDAMLSACPNDVLALLLSPMCRLVPRYFMKHLHSTPSLTVVQVDKLLKSIVACQQNISMLLESSKLETLLDRRLQDTISEEFDRIKRYVSLVHYTTKEFMEYMKSPSGDFTADELRYIWTFLVRESKVTSLPKFDDLMPRGAAVVHKAK